MICTGRASRVLVCAIALMTVGGTVSGTVADVAQADDLAKGLVGHWKFDGDVADSSPSGKHGVASGSPEFVEGKVGQAIRLDGQTQYIEVEQLAENVTQFTIAVWMHVEGMPKADQFASIFSNNGWENGDVHLPFAGPDGVLDLGIKGNEPSMSVPAMKVKDFLGRWFHLAVTYDGDKGKVVRFYVDGELSEEFKIDEVKPAKLGPGRIGSWDTQDRWFHGLLDEMTVYERALSAEEVAALIVLASKE